MDVAYLRINKEYKKCIPIIKNDRLLCYQIMEKLKKNK